MLKKESSRYVSGAAAEHKLEGFGPSIFEKETNSSHGKQGGERAKLGTVGIVSVYFERCTQDPLMLPGCLNIPL